MKERLIKFKDWISNNKVKSILSLMLFISLVIGLTAAAFIASDSGEVNTITFGTLKIEYTDGQTLNASNGLPLLESEVDEYASKTKFSVKNTGDIIGYAEIALTINSLSPELNSEDFRWTLYRENLPISTGSFKNVEDKLVLKTDEEILPNAIGVNYSIAIWIRDNGEDQNVMLNKSLNAKIDVTATDKRGEYAEYGVNRPELVDGLIPVTYDDENDVWVKANVRKEWYSYANQKWANAVTVTSTNRSTYMSAKAGTEIPLEDINAMWVWIPRFKYKISNSLGIGIGTTRIESPPQIDVVFETGLNTTGVDEETYRLGIADDGTNTNYYTHPAFRNGAKVYKTTAYDIGGWDEELTGFWVGKFETGTSDETCNTSSSVDNCLDVDPIIKPNVYSLRNQNTFIQFDTALKFAGGTRDVSTGKVTFVGNDTYGLDSTVNTHAMKNTEWGAMAILSQSQYGKMGNSDYEGANKEIYVNNSYDASAGTYTGRSAGMPSSADTTSSTTGSYTYNNKACSDDTCTGEETINAGTGASTTGTIYGIYDTSGGIYEQVMTSHNYDTTEFRFISNKYKDIYYIESTNPAISKDIVILGDATWETMWWYSDQVTFIQYSNPTFSRGSIGSIGNVVSGIFRANSSDFPASPIKTFRSVLIP